jgi:hypothetical protein
MWSKKTVLSAIVGLSLFGVPPGAMAALNSTQPLTRLTSSWQGSSQHTPIVLADEDDHPGWHHHHHDDDWYRRNANDYNWGGRYRYQYNPGYFNPPPQGWYGARRRNYLEERRQVAINMQQQMLAQGDTNAAKRLGVVIQQLNGELGR